MALEPIRLDDLSWDDLMGAARARIPAASAGLWTLHAAVDPGITLLELYAALLEQRLFWMDQPCASRRRALLALLGERPQPALAAATVIAFTGELQRETQNVTDDSQECEVAKYPDQLPEVRVGTLLQMVPEAQAWQPRRSGQAIEEGPPLVFTTDQALHLLPLVTADSTRRPAAARVDPAAVRLHVGGADRTFDLHMGRMPCLVAADGAEESHTEIILRLSQKISGPETGVVALLLDLNVPAGVTAEWLPTCGRTVPAAAEASWWFSTSDDYEQIAAKDVQDGTGGLRRPGVVRLTIPLTRWQGVKEETHLYAYTLQIRVRRPMYSFLPRVKQIVPNAVLARHRRPAVLTDDDLAKLAKQFREWQRVPVPGPRLVLPAGERPVLAETVRLELKERGALRRWRAVNDLARSGPADRHFVVDRAGGALHFGDGVQGKLPSPETAGEFHEWFVLKYEVGGGLDGNVAARRSWVTLDACRWKGVNVVAAEEGAEPESSEEAARRTGAALRRPSRCVTGPDYETLAVGTPGAAVRRAHAAVGRHPDFPCVPVPGAVTVFIVPDLPPRDEENELASCGDDLTALQPDAGVLAAVRRHLDRARLLTQELYVRGPHYRAVELRVTLTGRPADADAARAQMRRELHRYLHPLWGGDDGRGWAFGNPLRPSALLRVLQNVLGAELTVTQVEISLDGKAGQSCADVPIDAHELPALRGVRLQFLNEEPTGGGAL